MLSREKQMNRNQLEYVSLDELVPSEHFVRKMEKSIDFSFIYPLVEGRYSPDLGRPSTDPVVLIKLALIQYISGLPSMQKTVEAVKTDLAYRWFLGLGFHDKIPHYSTLSKNYERRFKGTGLFEQIFREVLQQAADKQLIELAPSAVAPSDVQQAGGGQVTSKKTTARKLKFSNPSLKSLVS